MNFLTCDEPITTDASNNPVCTGGWYSLDPSQVRNELSISDTSVPALTPAEYSELWGLLVLMLVTAFGVRILKKMFMPNL